MPVKITSSVRRAYAQSEESVGVLIKADLERKTLTGIVMSVVEHIGASADEVDQLTPVEFQPTMSGPAVVLVDVEPGDLTPVLNRVGQLLTDRLAGHGVGDVTLTAMPTVRPLDTGPGWDTLVQAWFALRGCRPDGWQPVGWSEAPDWATDPGDLDAAIDQLVAWALALGGDTVRIAVSSGVLPVPVPAEAVLPMVRRVARQRSRPLVNGVYVWNAAGRVRRLYLHHWYGFITAAAGTTAAVPADWAGALGEMTTLLSQAGPWTDYGHLTRTNLMDMSGENGQRTAEPQRSLEDERTLIETGTLIDAYGVIRLPVSWADRLPLEPTWSRTSLPGGQVLAQHHDPQAWYGTPRINPDTLTAARRQLGDAVMTRTGESLSSLDY